MTTQLQSRPVLESPWPGGRSEAPPAFHPPRRRRLRSLLQGRADDPAWARPALIALLVSTAALYLWGLGASGWANSYYSAAVQAGAHSWKAFFFGSSDASNFISVDKAPAFLWPMEISARIFGVNAWSILAPQALEGVAAVALLHAAVRRWFTPAAGLLAGAVLALTPVAALMFRFNNPDALLVLLLTASAYAMTRALERASTRWVALTFSLVGFAFLAKMLQAFLVVPAFGLVYLLAAPTSLRRRITQLAIGAGAMIVAAGWWVAAVELTPASMRPYIGGSQNNSLLNLIFGYNGFGRLTGAESGSVGGGGQGTGRWGATGLGRLFNAEFGGQASWLLPAAAILLVGVLVMTWRSPRTARPRAAMLLWGGWLVVTAAAISLGKGIIHPYYTVALAPATGAVVGIGATTLWHQRHRAAPRLVLASAVAVTAWWSWQLLGRTPSWHPGLRPFVLIGGLAAALLMAVGPAAKIGPRLWAAIAAVAIVVTLAGPAAYTWATVTTAHSGAIPSAGPAGAGGFGAGGFGPGGAGGGGAGPGGAGGAAFVPGGPGGPGTGTGAGGTAGVLGTGTGTGGPGRGGPPGFGVFGGNAGTAAGQVGGLTNGAPGGAGGILSGSTPDAELTATLKSGSAGYTWVAATVSANQAAGYQLASNEPVMAIGGFNGTDPAPSLAQFQQYVREGKIHYFIAGGGGPGGAGPGGGAGGGAGTATASVSSQITTWVESTFASTTVGNATLYVLTASA